MSADGLVLTNHHVVASGLEDISGPGKDYVADGFLARMRDQEIRLPGRQLDVLISIEDVTDRVNAAVDPKLPPDQAVKVRHAIFADIERESLKQTGLHSDVVTLYGDAYHLYRYKRYSDIRIVFAPEAAEAFFGGDPDNFEYPRFCLDIALVRAYENGKPADVENFLRLSRQGPSDGDLVFVSGYPGRTDRLLTVCGVAGMRDFTLLCVWNIWNEGSERFWIMPRGRRAASGSGGDFWHSEWAEGDASASGRAEPNAEIAGLRRLVFQYFVAYLSESLG